MHTNETNPPRAALEAGMDLASALINAMGRTPARVGGYLRKLGDVPHWETDWKAGQSLTLEKDSPRINRAYGVFRNRLESAPALRAQAWSVALDLLQSFALQDGYGKFEPAHKNDA